MKAAYSLWFILGVILLVVGGREILQGPDLKTIRVVCIPSPPLAIVVADKNGIFQRYGIEVQLETAPNSEILRNNLANGKADLAHAAVDNAVAMVVASGPDAVIVMGGEGSQNELIAQPGIQSIPGLRGRTLIVDAPNTAFALQLKKILLLNGMQAGRDYELKSVGATPQRLEAMRQHMEYAASMLGPPTSILAKREGFVSLGSTQKIIGRYQGLGAFVMRQWAREHSDTLVCYLAAYVEAQRWLLAPINKQQVIELLIKKWKLPASVAAEMYSLMVRGEGGYAQDARFDPDGFKNVLKLRAEVEGRWGDRPPTPEKYYDPSYYEQALSRLGLLQEE